MRESEREREAAIERADEDTEHLIVGIIDEILLTFPICM